MPRLHFELPKCFRFSTDVLIYSSHINFAGHLDNVQLLALVSEARARFFKTLGYSVVDVAGHPMAVGDMGVQYLSEAFHGETVQVEMEPTDFNKYGFDLTFRMREKTTGRDVARGKTGLIFLQRETRKVAPVPAAFMERLAQVLGTPAQ